MADCLSNPRIELEAVHLAAEWKTLFAAELKAAAVKLAEDPNLLTADDYRKALPRAVSALLLASKTETFESRDAPRRVA